MRLRWPDGLCLPSLRAPGRMVGHAGPGDLSRLSSPGFGHGRNDLPGHPQAFASLVSSDLAGHQPEERRQRAQCAAGSRPGKLSDRLDMVAQVAAGHGSPWAGLPRRASGSRRDVCGWRERREGWSEYRKGFGRHCGGRGWFGHGADPDGTDRRRDTAFPASLHPSIDPARQYYPYGWKPVLYRAGGHRLRHTRQRFCQVAGKTLPPNCCPESIESHPC